MQRRGVGARASVTPITTAAIYPKVVATENVDDTRGHQVARKHPGSLAASTIVSFARQIGYAQTTGELEAGANVRRLVVSYFDRALLAQVGPRFPVLAERERRTLAEVLDALMSGQIMTAMDITGQQFRAIEASILEDGGWSVARHLEVVPGIRVSSVTTGQRAMMAAAERQSHRLKHDLWRRPRDPQWRPWSGVCERREESRRSQPPRKRRQLAQCSGAVQFLRKNEKQRQRKKQRRQSEEGRTFRKNSNNDPRRGCLADVITEGTLPEDRPYIGRSKRTTRMEQPLESTRRYVALSAKGCRKLWEDVEFARWAVASVASARSQTGQPCHGDVVIRALPEAKSEEEQCGGALPRLEGLSLCEAGWALKSHLRLTPRRTGLATCQKNVDSCSTRN